MKLQMISNIASMICFRSIPGWEEELQETGLHQATPLLSLNQDKNHPNLVDFAQAHLARPRKGKEERLNPIGANKEGTGIFEDKYVKSGKWFGQMTDSKMPNSRHWLGNACLDAIIQQLIWCLDGKVVDWIVGLFLGRLVLQFGLTVRRLFDCGRSLVLWEKICTLCSCELSINVTQY